MFMVVLTLIVVAVLGTYVIYLRRRVAGLEEELREAVSQPEASEPSPPPQTTDSSTGAARNSAGVPTWKIDV